MTGLHNETPERTDVPWWRRGVVYQVYLRSFADGNGDGTGDINGLRSRLPHLAALGVDALWINPWYASPLADGGYDVADYRRINPAFGTVADAEALITEAHQAGIRIIADVVPNHTSEQHEWFVEALASPPGSAARARYHFRDGRGPDGSLPPNDWMSVFGGPAWTQVPDGQWYLHLFASEQPDMNWTNPEVRAEFLDVLTFWLDRGVDGFRVDVAHGLVKDAGYADLGENDAELLGSSRRLDHPHWDQDGIHEIVREWRALLNRYDGDRMMVAEAWVRPERLPLYLRPDEYHQSFNFDFLQCRWEAAAFRQVIAEASVAAAAVGSTSTWVLSNHDVMREATRYGLPNDTNWRTWPVEGPPELLDEALGQARARALALLMLGLPGSAYVYQGEELGLPEVWDLPEAVLDDPVFYRSGGVQRGRDGCRVPLPWDGSEPSFGFGPPGSTEPWLPQPASFAEFAAEAQAGREGSFLEMFRAAISLRSKFGVSDEEVHLLDLGPDVVAYQRGSGLTCVVNFGSSPMALPPHDEVLLTSAPDGSDAPGQLGPNNAVWLR